MSFPTTYAPNLTSVQGALYCSMNGLFLACTVDNPYTIVLKNLPLVVPGNTSFVIRVFGLAQPSTFYTGSTSVFVGLTNQLASTRLFDESGEISDV